MIILDGSFGEGGGQILRTGLCLSLITQTPVKFEHIRAKRPKPGLRQQHLTCVLAAQRVGNAHVEGAKIHATELTFSPQSPAMAGKYHFVMPTAGSTLLVLQTILPALASLDSPSEVVLEGGTHNPMSPPFEYIEQVFAPCLERMGPQLKLQLERPGFFPTGGGKLRATIIPAPWRPLHLPQTQDITRTYARIISAGLPTALRDKTEEYLRKKTALPVEHVGFPQGEGLVIQLCREGQVVNEIMTACGQKRRPLETVLKPLLKAYKTQVKSPFPVGEYLADQLLLPMALAGSGSFYTGEPSLHTLTNIHTIAQFLDLKIQVGQTPEGWRIQVG